MAIERTPRSPRPGRLWWRAVIVLLVLTDLRPGRWSAWSGHRSHRSGPGYGSAAWPPLRNNASLRETLRSIQTGQILHAGPSFANPLPRRCVRGRLCSTAGGMSRADPARGLSSTRPQQDDAASLGRAPGRAHGWNIRDLQGLEGLVPRPARPTVRSWWDPQLETRWTCLMRDWRSQPADAAGLR